jgi:uncharacterized repeat protein (TIGR01451 family)
MKPQITKTQTLTQNLKNTFILLAFGFAFLQVATLVGITSQAAAGDSLTQTVVGTFVDKNGNGLADIGDQIDYQYTIKNTGTSNLTAVNPVTSTVCLPLQPKVVLAAGASDSTTFKCTYNITAADITAGKVTNTTKAWSYNPVFEIIYSAGETTVTPLTAAKDELTQTVVGTFVDKNGNTTADAGDVIKYQYTITNTGTSDLTAVNPVASTTCLPLQPKIVLKGGASDSTTFTCDYTITAADITAGKVTNTNKAWSYNPAFTIIYSAENVTTTPLTVTPALVDKLTHTVTGTFVDKNANGVADLGDTVDYVYTYSNDGTSDLNTVNLKIANCDPETPTAIKAGETATTKCSFPVLVTDITAGKATNASTPWAFNPVGIIIEGPSVTTVTPLTIATPKVDKLTHTVTGTYVDKNDNGIVDLGDTIDYEYTYENTGTSDLNTVNLKIANCDPETPTAIKAGETATTTCSFPVTAADITAGEQTNKTTPWAFNPAGIIIEGSEVQTVTPLKTVVATGDYEVVKEGTFADNNSNGEVDLGDTIEYIFTIKNTSAGEIKDIELIDPLCQPTGTLATLAAGANDTTTFKCSYTLNSSDNAAGEVKNTATSIAVDSLGDPLEATSNTVITKLPVKQTVTPPVDPKPTPTPTPIPTPKPVVVNNTVTKPAEKPVVVNMYNSKATPRTGGNSTVTLSLGLITIASFALARKLNKKVS